MKWMKFQKSIYCKANKLLLPLLKKSRLKKLKNQDFSIICNNCWGGYVYRHFGLPYLTPTIGLYFFAEDFVKLCRNPQYYFKKELTFIQSCESKWEKRLIERGQTKVPIGKIDDIEIVFLHYESEDEAYEKWTRRCKRVNYDNLIYKFSKMNDCTDNELRAFDDLDVNKKICFVPINEEVFGSSTIAFKSELGEEVVDDTSEYGRYIDLIKLINSQKVNGKHME